jgi:hypothetical protein
MIDPVAAPPARPDAADDRRAQVRAAGLIVVVLAVVGAALGLVWQAWSPPGPIGVQLPAGIQADETEAWAAGDGRYMIIAVAVGVVTAIAAWYAPPLRRVRGPFVALGVAIGALAGSGLTDLVGWAVRGDGNDYSCGAGTCIDHLPLTVHMHGLWFLEAFIAVLGYGLFVAFAVADDLGRPDVRKNVSSALQPGAEPVTSSVGPQHEPQDGRGYGDAAGVP